MKMDEHVYPDLAKLNRAVLDEIRRAIDDAISKRGRFTIALSGGHTPSNMYALWAEDTGAKTPWDSVHLFWGDERYVPENDPRSNYRMLRETLISRVAIPPANVHPFRTNLSTPEAAAVDYDATLRKFFGNNPPALDVQLLGVGEEGHTASLFPGSPALNEKQRWAMAVTAPVDPPQRLTLTPGVLNRGRNTFFLVAGEEKREILQKLRDEPNSETSEFPAARLQPGGRTLWFLDKNAAG